MTKLLPVLLGCLVLVAWAPHALALNLQMNSVDFPEGTTVGVEFSPQAGAPPAKISAKVNFKDGQAVVDLDWKDLKPAILFGGDITCYVLWAVTRDGNVSNLGEFGGADPKGKSQVTTRNRAFAMMITAEPYYLVRMPSAYPAFLSEAPSKKGVTSAGFDFSGFRPLTPKRDVDDIQPISWDSTTPLPLLQARKAQELAGQLGAKQYSAQFYDEADEALAQANSLYEKSPKKKDVIDYSRRAVALSNEAINVTIHRIEGVALEKMIAERRAEMAAMEQEAMKAEARAREAEARTREAEVTKARMGAMLQGALAAVAETRESARGIVVSLPDILFDSGKATLKPDAKLVLAQMSGILLIMGDFGAIIEGHTDSTGTPEFNMKLSLQRAESVMEFLAEQDIAPNRMKALGFGIEKPIASNDTPEGRKQNRRVEIIINEM